MKHNLDYTTARDILLNAVAAVGTERVALSQSGGRLLAQELTAVENIPPFDRSPYDGYAFRAADSTNARKDHPITLRILEELPAGAVPTTTVTSGTAVKILTGAPIPPGADAVVPYERTRFTAETVCLYAPAKSGENIVMCGEDVQKGEVLAKRGSIIDAGLAGTLAAQGIEQPEVYRLPRIGILSTGSELVEAGKIPGPGQIRNTNRYMLEAALSILGFECLYLGTAGDSTDEIRVLLQKGLELCDGIISTGGVSVGDYDLTPEAIKLSGAELLFQGVELKPGMACAYGLHNGKPICALSGNPASALTNFYAVALPALRKLAGHQMPLPHEITVTLLNSFEKKSPKPRLLRGKLVLRDGVTCIALSGDQGNAVLSSAVGCSVMAVVPAGSGPLASGTVLKGFLL